MIVPVAGGIFGISHVEGVVGIHLCFIGYYVAFSLLCDYVVDECFPCFEVVTYFFHLIFRLSLCKDRKAELFTQRINSESRGDDATVHIHGNIFSLDTHFAVFDIGIAVEVSHVVAGKNHGILSSVIHGCFQGLVFHRSTVLCGDGQAILSCGGYRVRYGD